jgi:NAD(P)H-dependent FMN reductase
MICGSLRANSSNLAALKTVQHLVADRAIAGIYDGIADLPHFNPDLDHDPLPEPISELRQKLGQADAVFFSTPEYAGSLPGAFKNLLDWCIGGASPSRKPVGWINVSAHGGAQETYRALRSVLTWAEADIVEAACVEVPVRRDAYGVDGIIGDEGIRDVIRQAIRGLIERV